MTFFRSNISKHICNNVTSFHRTAAAQKLQSQNTFWVSQRRGCHLSIHDDIFVVQIFLKFHIYTHALAVVQGMSPWNTWWWYICTADLFKLTHLHQCSVVQWSEIKVPCKSLTHQWTGLVVLFLWSRRQISKSTSENQVFPLLNLESR